MGVAIRGVALFGVRWRHGIRCLAEGWGVDESGGEDFRHGLDGALAGEGYTADFDDGVGAADALSEGGVAVVEALCGLSAEADEDLSAVGVGVVGACHGDDAEIVREFAVFEVNHVPRPAAAAARGVADLDDEGRIAGDDAMKGDVGVVPALDEMHEVPAGVRSLVRAHAELHLAVGGGEDDVPVHVRAVAGENGRGRLLEDGVALAGGSDGVLRGDERLEDDGRADAFRIHGKLGVEDLVLGAVPELGEGLVEVERPGGDGGLGDDLARGGRDEEDLGVALDAGGDGDGEGHRAIHAVVSPIGRQLGECCGCEGKCEGGNPAHVASPVIVGGMVCASVVAADADGLVEDGPCIEDLGAVGSGVEDGECGDDGAFGIVEPVE